MTEYLDILDQSGKVIGQASQKAVYEKNCTSAGGHVRSGETYEQAAKRELYEEIGLHTSLHEVHQFVFESDSHKSFIALFGAPATKLRRGKKIHPQLEPCLQWVSRHQDIVLQMIQEKPLA